MDLTADPLFVQLRKALRTGLAGVPAPTDVHGAPNLDGAHGPTRTVLDALEAPDFERPADRGGLGLGLTAGVLVSEELGRAACGNSYRADALAADLDGPAGAALAGFEALPVGSGIAATARAGGWMLTGTVTVDDPASAVLLVAVRAEGEPVLVAVPRNAAGVTVEAACRPPVVRFAATPVDRADVVGAFDDSAAGPLARARLRQAAYLVGIADGAHCAAVRYAGFRRQFDSRLRDLPAVAFPLARAQVALRAAGAAVYRGAWLVDCEPEQTGAAALIALATAAETARDLVRLCMQSCGVRAMTAELGLHRYFRLTAAESARYGDPASLWRLVGATVLESAERAFVPAATASSTPCLESESVPRSE